MIDLWKPAVIAAYCNRGRSGTTLKDSGPIGTDLALQSSGSWSQINGHNDRWSLDMNGDPIGAAIPFRPSEYPKGMSITAWIYLDGSQTRTICGIRSSANRGFLLRAETNNRLQVVKYGTADQQTPDNSLMPNVWNHIAFTISATNPLLWINGVTRGPTITESVIFTGVASLGIWGVQNFWDASGAVGSSIIGSGADLCVWPKVLSSDEIAWLANPANNIIQLPSSEQPRILSPHLIGDVG